MNVSELREKSVNELQAELVETLKDQFNLRMKSATGQLAKNHKLAEVRRQVARIKTILTEKQGK